MDYINSREPTIKFTLEVESKFQNKLILDVYRKPTNTDRYLNFTSNHSISVKKGVIKSLYDRAKIICTDDISLNRDINHIKNTLIKNDYPPYFIDKTLNEIQNPNHRHKDNNTQYIQLTIPYIRGVSEKIRRIGKQYNIRTSFKTQNTLRSILSHTKPMNTEQQTKNVIYQIPCECDKFYIGETSRPLNVRIKEHKDYLRKGDFHKSKICQHSWDTGHRINFNNAKIIMKEAIASKRKIKEAFLIQSNKNKCIAHASVDVSNVWQSLL